jgi:hypothetical protein
VGIAVLRDTFLAQRYTLMNAEAMLFVDNYKRKVLKLHTLLKKGVRANDETGTAVGNRCKRFAPAGGSLTATEPGRLNAKWSKPVAEATPVLLGE